MPRSPLKERSVWLVRVSWALLWSGCPATFIWVNDRRKVGPAIVAPRFCFIAFLLTPPARLTARLSPVCELSFRLFRLDWGLHLHQKPCSCLLDTAWDAFALHTRTDSRYRYHAAVFCMCWSTDWWRAAELLRVRKNNASYVSRHAVFHCLPNR